MRVQRSWDTAASNNLNSRSRELRSRTTSTEQKAAPGNKPEVFATSKPDSPTPHPVMHFLQQSHTPLNLCKQRHQLGTEYSNTWVCGGYFYSNHHRNHLNTIHRLQGTQSRTSASTADLVDAASLMSHSKSPGFAFYLVRRKQCCQVLLYRGDSVLLVWWNLILWELYMSWPEKDL